MERMERQRRNPPSRSITPSDSAGSSSSASRRSYSNRNRNSDYKYSKHNTNSNRSYEDDSDWRSRRSSDSKSYVQKLEPKEDGVGYGGISHSDLPPVLVGTCPSMCPEAERAQRERLRDLAIFERLHGNPGKTSPDLAVKKFCRTMSSKNVQAFDVRPLPVLENALEYVLSFLDSKEQPFEVIHDFIFDRTRSIRQDLSIQNIVNDKAIYMYEEMVKFHIISHQKLLNGDGSPNASSMHHLNMQQLSKALITLLNLYEVNRSNGAIFKNEAEFHSFFVLLHLGSNSQATGESLTLWFRTLRSPVIKSKEMRFARRTLRYFRMCNYKGFLCTIGAEASNLQYCILEPYVNEVRALALSFINNGGYKLNPYPLMDLSTLLMMEESEVESFCKSCGLVTCVDELGNLSLPTKQTTFSCPSGAFQRYSFLRFK
ncbi:SAC3 family protein C isoform X2 [Momordica charantia]|uniref:SAC3 family protein C isoform X2 n=1 Tax=Momordica charantia TaxID=3673 RepID=A0A6J1CDN0_MOMCH|nr:SAC3 family protein C isoform X2 [Momordica charantia]